MLRSVPRPWIISVQQPLIKSIQRSQWNKWMAISIRRCYSNTSHLDKYRSKLQEKAQKEGFSSIEELTEKYKDEIIEKKKEFNTIGSLEKLMESNDSKPSKSLGPLPPSLPKADIKTLDSFIDVSKLKLHDSKEIEMLWKARFANKSNALCGSMNGQSFGKLYKYSRIFPSFVLPLPHGNDGIEFHYIQWSLAGPTTLHCIFTPLAEYKLHQDFARPHITLIFHSDLVADKDLVLMNGSVEKDSSLTLEDAILLSLNLQRFYTADETKLSGAKKLKLLYDFNNGDSAFSTDQLIAELETVD